MCGTRAAAASADERAPGLRSGGPRADVRGVQHRRADSRLRPGGVAITGARRAFHGIARPPAVRERRSPRAARRRLRRSPAGLVYSNRPRACRIRRRGRPVVERAGARAHPAAAGHSRESERSARGRRPGRHDGDRDCRRARVRDSHDPAARRADGARCRVRPGLELGPHSPSVVARNARRTTPVRAARRSLARRERLARDVPGSTGNHEREAARSAPIHPN